LSGAVSGNVAFMRAIFVVYLTLVVTGIAFYTVIGLTHH
jgi:hypothetical protein